MEYCMVQLLFQEDFADSRIRELANNAGFSLDLPKDGTVIQEINHDLSRQGYKKINIFVPVSQKTEIIKYINANSAGLKDVPDEISREIEICKNRVKGNDFPGAYLIDYVVEKLKLVGGMGAMVRWER